MRWDTANVKMGYPKFARAVWRVNFLLLLELNIVALLTKKDL